MSEENDATEESTDELLKSLEELNQAAGQVSVEAARAHGMFCVVDPDAELVAEFMGVFGSEFERFAFATIRFLEAAGPFLPPEKRDACQRLVASSLAAARAMDESTRVGKN